MALTDEEKAQKIMQLAQEFAQNELAYNSRIVFDPETGTLWFPEPWIGKIEQVKARAEAEGAMVPQILPIPAAELAPMSDTLRELAHELGFPEYDGLALPASMITEQPEEQQRRVRCPSCGSWMEFQNILEWKYARDKYPLRRKPEPSGPRVCGSCGYGLDLKE